MGVSIRIESPRGTIVPSQLLPGQTICIAGRATTAIGAPNSFQDITVDLFDGFAPIHWDTGTDWNGWYWIDNIVLPNVTTQAIVRVGANYLISGWEYAELPIGLGVKPPPPSTGGFNWLPYLFLAGGVIVVLVLVTRVTKAIKGVTSANPRRSLK